jgi:myo-inositol catabolism protein IolC
VTAARSFVLAIDHRSSFRRWSTECVGAPVDPVTLCRLKLVVASALVAAVAAGGSLEATEAALLVDDEYGGLAMARARSAGIRVVVPAERSGLPEFVLEHGDDFGGAILRSGADAVKALVRYNPASDRERNTRSRRGLVRLAEWCEGANYPLMLELLVPPDERDLDPAGKPPPGFDSEIRPSLTCSAIAEIREEGLDPAWWKLEGQPSPESFSAVAAATGAAATGSRTACLVLGRGAGEDQLTRWVRQAAATQGFAGFAVGRSLWIDSLAGVLAGTLTEEAATSRIAASYLALVDLYTEAAEPLSRPQHPEPA